jgi:hypothetical protein
MSFVLSLEPHANPRIDALTGAQRLRWVLEFIRRDLEVLSAEVVEALGDDLRHATAPEWVHEGYCADDISAAQVRALQKDILEGIDAILGNSIDFKEMMHIHRGDNSPQAGWALPEATTHLVRVRFDRHGQDMRLICISQGTNNRTAILMGVVILLQAYGQRLSTCPVCGAPFLRQYRQAYCNVRCSNKVRNRRRLDKQTHSRKNQRHRTATTV